MRSRARGITHPAWLIAHAQNLETDPIHRGKWIREKLLAGTIPDVPITVDAVIPEDPHKTLRQRLDAKTNNDYCIKCHQKMNPLGLPFELYDDFGRFRTQERLEYPENLVQRVKDKGAPHEDLRDIYKTLPVDPRGYLSGAGDDRLDGEVADAPLAGALWDADRLTLTRLGREIDPAMISTSVGRRMLQEHGLSSGDCDRRTPPRRQGR